MTSGSGAGDLIDSKTLFERSKRSIPGGVNSPVRAFAAVGGTPVFFLAGEGAHLTDVSGRRYVDYVCSWGAIIAGHGRSEVAEAVREAALRGNGFGAPTEIECRFAERLCAAVPSMDMARAVNSGTEATMSAIRLARGFSGRDMLVKFDGCYHGHADSLLVAAGSGSLTLGRSSSAGVPAGASADTLVLPYNDPQAAADAFAKYGDKIAAVIVEPLAGNMNMVRGSAEFLKALRDLCSRHGAALIFDEVMSGFRVAAGGAQTLHGIDPDLTCLGKVVGGGLGVAAFGGRRDIMENLAPLGGVYQAGTLSGNPVALAAGLAALDIVLADGFFEKLGGIARSVTGVISDAARKHGAPFCADSEGGMFGLYFRGSPPCNLEEARDIDMDMFKKFFHAMLARGMYFAPSAFEAGFVTAAHGEEELRKTKDAAEEAFAEIAQS